MIDCQVSGKGRERRVTLTLKANSPWSDRYPKVRTPDDVTVTWWDCENLQPISKLSWSAKKKLLQLPIPLGDGSSAKMLLGEVDRSVGGPVAIIRVPGQPEDVRLGVIRCSVKSAELIQQAIVKVNEYLRAKSGACCGLDEPVSVSEGLVTESGGGIAAARKIAEEVESLGSENDRLLDEMKAKMEAIQTARERIDFLMDLKRKWEVPGTAEPSDIGLDD